MRLGDRAAVAITICLAGFVAGCHGSPDRESTFTRGRFVGIGTYSAGQLWSKMVASSSMNPEAATTADDEHIIVVVDSQTGEVRECGDYSGVCAGFNPWTRAIAVQQTAPVKLTKHATDLAAEARSTSDQSR